MQDTKSNEEDKKSKSPKMEKPVTGSFQQSRKKLGGMVKQGRKNLKKGNDKDVR